MNTQPESWHVYPPGGEEDPYVLPTIIEMFYVNEWSAEEGQSPGWYVGSGLPGCLYDNCEGPFDRKEDALEEVNRIKDEIENPEEF